MASLTPEILARLSVDHFGADYADALAKWSASLDAQPKTFASKAAEKLYNELKPSGVRATGRGGKISIDDVRAAAGLETKRKAPSEFSHPSALELAQKHGLTSADFSDASRTGNPTQSPLASGCVNRITISDVRRTMVARGLGDSDVAASLFTSPGVAKAAREAGLSPSDFAVKAGKISKADVTAAIQAQKMASEPNPFAAIEETQEAMATVEE